MKYKRWRVPFVSVTPSARAQLLIVTLRTSVIYFGTDQVCKAVWKIGWFSRGFWLLGKFSFIIILLLS